MRYFLIGFMGSGKSYWGKQWSAQCGLPLVELDDAIEKAAGMTIAQIFEQEGEQGFRKRERKVLRQYLKQDGFIMSCGGGTACFFRNMKDMNAKGITVYLKSTPQQLAERLKDEKTKRPLIKDMTEEGLLAFIKGKLTERKLFYSQSFYHLETAFLTHDNFDKIFRRHGS
jgi:shikimate kinase